MDIVYILRNGIEGDELRYSLRTLKNIPHDKVWFFGGEPSGLKPDRQVTLQQQGVSVWSRVSWTLEQVCKNKEVSDDFILFNDDFFVMKPIDELPPYFDMTLYKRCQQIRKRRGGQHSIYEQNLMRLREMLMSEHKKTYNYAVHVPMVINKKKALEVLGKYRRMPMFRSLYGNYWNIGGEQLTDCKIVKKDIEPSEDAVFLSTSEASFAHGKVGEYIRSQFTEECEYEVHNNVRRELQEVAETEAVSGS